jgi:hypothetical protein
MEPQTEIHTLTKTQMKQRIPWGVHSVQREEVRHRLMAFRYGGHKPNGMKHCYPARATSALGPHGVQLLQMQNFKVDSNMK